MRIMKKKLIIILSILVAFFYVRQLRKYEINKVTVLGNIMTTENDIVSSIPSTNMYDCSLKQLRKNVLELPWVANCTIKKLWPNEIIILIEEEIPILEGKNCYITEKGNIVKKDGKDYPISRIQFKGQFVVSEMRDAFKIIQQYTNLLKTIDAIHRKRENRFDLHIKGKIIKCLDDDLNGCIIRYLSLPQGVPNTKNIDLRHPQRVVFY